MKRTLSLVLALVMLLGTIPAFAADTAAEQAAFLEEMGVLKGNTAGDLMLAAELKREDSVVMLARLLGLEAAAEAWEGAPTWTDLPENPYYVSFLAWAQEEGYYKGHSDLRFGFGETITANDFALVLWRALGYEDPAVWSDAFDAAVELGLLEGLDLEATDKLLRGDMAVMVYLALGTEMAEGGKTLAEELGVEMPVVAMTAEVTGRKELTITFSKAVDAATFAVTRGNITVNFDSAVLAEDGKSAVITMTVPMMAGDYTVKVSGVAEDVLEAVVKVEAEKVTAINLLSAKAPMTATNAGTATVSFEVLNQYGEGMPNVQVNWTQSTGVVIAPITTGTDGTGSITVTNAASAQFIPGTIVYLNGVYTNSSLGYAVVENTQVEIVLPAHEAEVVFAGVYNNTTGKMSDLPAGFAAPGAASNYRLLFEVKDQYGNVMTTPDLSKIVFTSSNPLFVTIGAADGLKLTKYQSVVLVAGNNVNAGGMATIQAISTLTGTIRSTTIEAAAKASLNSFTMSAPTTLVAGNDTKVEIPFVALDQFSTPITKFDVLNPLVNNGLTLTGNVAFEKQTDGSAKLFFYPTSNTTGQDSLVYITSVVAGGNFSSQMLTVKPNYKPVVITGLDSKVNRTIFEGETVLVADSKLTILDQYGRTIKATDFAAMSAAYTIVRTEANSSGGAVALVSGGVQGSSVGSEVVTFTLYDVVAGANVNGSALSVTFTTVALTNLTSYAIEDIDTIYASYGGEFVVYGMTSAGAKVTLPTGEYNASASKSVTVSGNALTTSAVVFGTNVTEVTAVLTVVINETGDILTKEFVVTNVAPMVDVLEVQVSSAAVTEITTTTASAITASSLVLPKLYVEDQYGEDAAVNTTTGVVTFDDATFTSPATFVISSLDSDVATIANNGLANATVNGVESGDSFNLTVFVGGKSVVVKVIVQ